MREITDSLATRHAVRILLQEFPEPRGFEPDTSTVGLLNETWARMAGALANADEADFGAILSKVSAGRDHLVARRDGTTGQRPDDACPNDETTIAGYDRALTLLDLVMEWRWRTYAAQEFAAGRDPYQPVGPD